MAKEEGVSWRKVGVLIVNVYFNFFPFFLGTERRSQKKTLAPFFCFIPWSRDPSPRP